MPHDMKFEKLPAGFAAKTVTGPCMMDISVKEFLSSDDGSVFVDRLEHMDSMLFPAISHPFPYNPADINHYLAVIRPDCTGTIYVNELEFRSMVLPKQTLEAGQNISIDDLADVRETWLYLGNEPITVPKDCGVAVFFRAGWRSGLLYDFSPLSPGGTPRDYAIEWLFANCYLRSLFHTRLQEITDDDWNHLFEERWFPFISLKTSTTKDMLNLARNAQPIDELLERIHQEVLGGLDAWLSRWERNRFFKDHIEFLRKAVEHFRKGDFMSAVSILFPRIEGILRSHYTVRRPSEKMGQGALVETAIDNVPRAQHSHSLLRPSRFRNYLDSIFFEDFDPNDPLNVSRNTIAHGVAPASDCNAPKNTLLGILILDQLSYYLVG